MRPVLATSMSSKQMAQVDIVEVGGDLDSGVVYTSIFTPKRRAEPMVRMLL